MATPSLFMGAYRPIGAAAPLERFALPAHHLVTHGIAVGATGSGKTGLLTVLIE